MTAAIAIRGDIVSLVQDREDARDFMYAVPRTPCTADNFLRWAAIDAGERNDREAARTLFVDAAKTVKSALANISAHSSVSGHVRLTAWDATGLPF